MAGDRPDTREAARGLRPTRARDARRFTSPARGPRPFEGRARALRLVFAAALALACAACSASRGPEAERPRPDQPPYPVVLSASEERREQVVNNWLALSHARGAAGAPAPPELQPVTATIRALPAPAPDLRLPLVEMGAAEGVDADEATRESLRRFITNARELLGVELENLSLAEVRDEGGGTRLARYVQKPFPYPLRNGFGLVEIRFAADRRVVGLSSTAVPDTARLTRAFAALRPSLITAEQVAARLSGRTINFDPAQQPFVVAPGDTVNVRELVVFPSRRAADAGTLEIRLAWESLVTRGATSLLVHSDAVGGEILAAAPTTERASPTPTPSATPTPAPTATPNVAPTPTPTTTPTTTPTPTPTPAPTTTLASVSSPSQAPRATARRASSPVSP